MDADRWPGHGTGDRALRRAFVAVRLPSAVTRPLAEIQERLRRCGAPVRWVNPDDLHLTLVFVGDVPAARRDALATVLEEAAAGARPIALQIRGLGLFGPPRAPRVVWAGVSPADAALETLAGRLAADLRAAGWPVDDRPFRPHVTLGRPRGPHRAGALTTAVHSLSSISRGSVDADRVALMAAAAPGAARRYVVVRDLPLKG